MDDSSLSRVPFIVIKAGLLAYNDILLTSTPADRRHPPTNNPPRRNKKNAPE